MNKNSSFFKSTIILISLTSLCTLFLAGGNALYSGVLEERQRALRMEILRSIGETFTDDAFNDLFTKKVKVVEDAKNKATFFTYTGIPAQAAVLITGATKTSTSLQNIINRGIRLYGEQAQ